MRTVLRILLGVALAVVVVWLLFTVVFPWVDARLLNDPTLSTWRAEGSSLRPGAGR